MIKKSTNGDRYIMTISLEEFIKYLIKKWKRTVVVIIVFAACFFAGAIFLGDEITVPHSEEYLRYEQELAWHESYLKESILMNLNPLSIHERSLFLKNIKDKDLLKNYAVSSEIWEGYDTDWSKKYISELVSWNENQNDNTVELIIRHATEEECLDAAEYLKEKLCEKDPSLELVVGAERIVTDENLQEEHLRWHSRIYYVNSLLLEAQAGYTLNVNKVAALIAGILTGGVVSLIWGLISFVIGSGKERG